MAYCVVDALFNPPLAVGNMPVTPVVNGNPVIFVATPLDGVPIAGVTKVGDILNTNTPVPVSSVTCPATAADVVGVNCANVLAVYAIPAGRSDVPIVPTVTGAPVEDCFRN